MAENNSVSSPTINKQTADSIEDLCARILVYEDHLDFEKSKEFIHNHIDNHIELIGEKHEIRFIVQNNIAQYVDACPNTTLLFAFASDNNYQQYKRDFQSYYLKYYVLKDGNPSRFAYPPEFSIVLDCIQEAIDFHKLYEKFSIKLSEDTVKRAIEEASEAASEAEKAARVAANIAQRAAGAAADKAVNSAIKQVINDQKVEKRINDCVDKQMGRVTTRISETSVTILGIFSGIVLTVVAGLFYSSSVLENINTANFFRLLSVASLIGFVCYHLLTVLFRFVEKFKTAPEEKLSGSSQNTTRDHTIFISVVLLIIFSISGVLQFVFPTTGNDGNLSTPIEPTGNAVVITDSDKGNTEDTSATETTSDHSGQNEVSDTYSNE